MKKPTKILSDEHQNILAVIDVLHAECDAVESGKNIDKDFFEKVIRFIQEYADKFHHAKEEDILFKELCKETVSLHCNPVEQMLYEHDTGRGFVKDMKKGLKSNDKEKLLSGARGYMGLLKEHIFKEDTILYPMADEALSTDIDDAMAARFKQVELSEELKALIEELKNYKKP